MMEKIIVDDKNKYLLIKAENKYKVVILDQTNGIEAIVIEVTDYNSIGFIPETEVTEVKPCFFQVKNEISEEGFPQGEINVNGCVKRVEILLPHPNTSEELTRMVGCAEIKQKFNELKSLAEYNKACSKQFPGLPIMKIFLHSVFYGNPGTGKTTVCRLYGSLLKEVGLLSKGHVVVADRSVFIGDHFGDTEAVVDQLLDMSKGGILMLDEAYLLDGVHHEDPNQMVLPLLLSVLADENKKDFCVVLCGYKDKLDKMLQQNPGLYSRFINRLEFNDYSLSELTEIGVRYLQTFGHFFSEDGLAAFKKELAAAMSGSSKTSWANARSAKSMIEHIYIRRAMRYQQEGQLDRIITAEDICSIPYEHRRRIGFAKQ